MSNLSTSTEWKNFSQNVLSIRKQNGFSKKKMAELLKISVGTLNKIERGEAPLRLSVTICMQIWKHFNIHPSNQFTPLEHHRVPKAGG